MNIESLNIKRSTKFNIGDVAYYIEDNKVKKLRIDSISGKFYAANAGNCPYFKDVVYNQHNHISDTGNVFSTSKKEKILHTKEEITKMLKFE